MEDCSWDLEWKCIFHSLLFQGILFTVVYGKLNLLSLGVARHASSIPPAKHIQYVPAIGTERGNGPGR